MITNVAAGVRAFTSNAFFVGGERPVLVDTGANFDILPRLADETDSVEAIVLTHTHSDHIGNITTVTEEYNADVWGYDRSHDLIDHELTDADTLTLGNDEYTALYTPGHATDHLCLYSVDADILFAGDLVFQNGSFGRTDLDGGDRQTLIESITRLLDTVSPSLTELHVGHGPSVTTNPYEHIELAKQFASQSH